MSPRRRGPLVYLIDAYVQIFRAYYAMPDLRAPDGTPVGAFRGYASTLVKFLERQAPTHVAAAFDFALTSFRNDLYPEYKAGRTEAPEDLEPQFELCARVTRALGIPVFSLENFEADDVIATLTRELVAAGARVAIVTTDKDLGALVTERVSLFDPRREEHAGRAQVEARLGVLPEQVADYLTLAGDSVDNIPGVRGIGARTAAGLLRHFGSLEAIPSCFEEWDGLELRGAARIAARLAEAEDEIRLSRELVRLRDDLPIRVKPADLEYSGADRRALAQLLDGLGAGPLLARVPRFRD